MKRIPSDRKYTETHLWFLPTDGEIGLVGFTDYGQTRLGDIIAIDLPRAGTHFAVQDLIACLEGILDSMDVEAFANMSVVETNPRLEIHPDLINRDPYNEGWILKVKLTGLPRWLNAPEYAEFIQNGAITEGA